MTPFLFDLALIIIIATIFSFFAKLLRQPLLVAYVIAGVIIGPIGLGWITGTEEINTLAELGVAFMLFIVGLEFDFKKLKSVGLSSVIGAVVQIAVTFVAGFSISLIFGFGDIISIYIGLLIAFSSTMIVAKILADRDEIKTLHGRLMLAILIIQDIVVIFVLPALSKMAFIFSPDLIFLILGKVALLFILAWVLNRFVFERILDYAAGTKEMLFFTAVTVCFAFMGIAYFLEFSIAIGAFIGGIALASFPYKLEIHAEMHSLRDFFSVIFFTTLGMQLNLFIIYSMFIPFIILLLVILLLKPFILSLIYLALGYGGRIASSISLGLSQASEFTFIIVAQGLILGHLTNDVYSLIVSLVVISMIFTPYFMKFRNGFYNVFSRIDFPGISRLAKPNFVKKLELKPRIILKNHIVLLGCDVMGRNVVKHLKNLNHTFIVADHNPETIKHLNQKGIYCVYGDAENEELLRDIGLYRANTAVITIPDSALVASIIRKAKHANPKLKVFVKGASKEDEKILHSAGADIVVIPDIISAEEISKKIETLFRKGPKRKLT